MMWARTLALLILSAGAAQAEQVTLQYPAGWTRSDLAAPVMDGHPITGSRHRAMLPGNQGRPLAAIELTELPQTTNHTADLPAMMNAAREQATSDFHAAKLDDVCTPAIPGRVAGEQPALRLDCVVSRADHPLLQQAIVMWVTPAGLYTLSYSAAPPAFATHQPEFDQALASIRLE